MKKNIKIGALLLQIIILIGCSKIIKDEDIYSKLDGNGEFDQLISINEYCKDLLGGGNNEFYPLKYEEGKVLGVIATGQFNYSYNSDKSFYFPDDYYWQGDIATSYFKLYEVDVNKDIIEENNKYLGEDEYELVEESNYHKIILKNKDKGKNVSYNIKKKFNIKEVIEKDKSYNEDGEEEVEFINYKDNNGNPLSFNLDSYRINERYQIIMGRVYVNYIESEEYLEEEYLNKDNSEKVTESIAIIFDNKENKFYEGEINQEKFIDTGIVDMYQLNNKEFIYMDKEANAIKLTLKDGAINQEIYMESDKKYESYFSENVIGNKEEGYIFIYSGHIQDNEYESRGIDIDNKKIIKYPYSLTVNSIENTKKYVYYVKSNSEQFNSNIEIWLGELIDNKLKDVQMLDSYNYYDGEHDNIKNVLYDKKSHSFFIKRRINGGWSYEILKI